MKTEDDGARQACPGPGETAKATPPTIDHPDAELLRLKREIENASDAGNTAATDEEAEPFLDLATKLRHELAEMPAHTLDGVIAKFDDYRRIHEGGAASVWDEDLLRTIREGLERLKPSADAKLFTLEVEMKAAHEGYATPKSDEDYWYDRMTAAEKATLAIPAKTPSDVAAKLRIFAYYQNPPRDDDSVFDECIRNVIEDAQRIGAAVPADPDAKLKILWRTYLQNRDVWDRAEEDTDEYERCAKESAGIAERISAAPAQGVHGLTVKLLIATNEPYEHRTLTDQTKQDDRALVSARDDAVRLTGIGGAS